MGSILIGILAKIWCIIKHLFCIFSFFFFLVKTKMMLISSLYIYFIFNFYIILIHALTHVRNIFVIYTLTAWHLPKILAGPSLLIRLLYLDMSLNNFNKSIPSFSMSKNPTQIIIFNNNLTSQITSLDGKNFWI